MDVTMKFLLRSRLIRSKVHVLSNNYGTDSSRPLPSQENVFEGEEAYKMAAWQIHSFGPLDELQFSKSVKRPSVLNPKEVLVKVAAASVNPIDIAMMGGYGHVLLNTLRQVESCSNNEIEFPLILGRDFAGEIVARGNDAKEFTVGDQIFGVTPPQRQGCHAQYVVAHKDWINHQPEHLTETEAASLLYSGLTAWSALKVTGDLAMLPARGKTVLVMGASGGVGSVAVQLLRAWGSTVVATCCSDAVPLVQSLGAETVIDYTQPSALDAVRAAGKYDIILDAAGLPESEYTVYMNMLKDWKLAKYITLRSPMLKNTDQLGLVGGMLRNAIDLVRPNVASGAVMRGASLRWGYFAPISAGIREIAHLAQRREVVPIIDTTFNIMDLPAAYNKVMGGHLRGKVVVTV